MNVVKNANVVRKTKENGLFVLAKMLVRTGGSSEVDLLAMEVW